MVERYFERSFRSGSVFLNIKTLIHTTMNAKYTKDTKLSCQIQIQEHATNHHCCTYYPSYDVRCFVNRVNFFNIVGKKLSLAIENKILVAANCITNNTDVKPVNAPIEINPATQF